jgi:hypothetical protein
MSLTKYKDGICMPDLLFVAFSLSFFFVFNYIVKKKEDKNEQIV